MSLLEEENDRYEDENLQGMAGSEGKISSNLDACSHSNIHQDSLIHLQLIGFMRCEKWMSRQFS